MARAKKFGCGPIGLLVVGLIVFAIISNDDDEDPPKPTPQQVVQTQAPSAPPAGAEVSPRLRYVIADTLNVRASPATDAQVLLKVTRGTTVTPTRQVGDWFGVPLSDGSIGWLHGAYLADRQEEPAKLMADTPPAAEARPAYNRDQVIEAIIEASIRSYSGNCPCPYNRMRNGRSCGGNSAYSKPGGRAPICYPQDVTAAMIEAFVARN